ncbi:DUF899 family protein [Pseudonocardia acaciae]|uniref:DUF899 family protein n=1 Tax=Pseudonocardia acaciae TaxID=551276 RepID=UPI000B280EB4|nr:DUF899 family protein [Pseudonocardia acaciae]
MTELTGSKLGAEWWTELKSITLHVEGDQPPMWAAGASEEYKRARRELAEAEMALRDQVEAVAAQRRELPPGPVLPEYRLVEGPLELAADGPEMPVTLADLFGPHDQLFVYHLMFHADDDEACPMCSLWVDGFRGVAHHIQRRAGLAVVAAAPLATLRRYARYRRWSGLRLVSAAGSQLLTDLGMQGSRGGQFPAFSVFTREGDRVRHAYTSCADFPDRTGRGMDLLSPVWNVLDVLPSGRGDWLPDNEVTS